MTYVLFFIFSTIYEEVQTNLKNQKTQSKFEIREELSKELASKEDVHVAKLEIGTSISDVKTDLETKISEVKADLEAKISELRTDLETVKVDLETKIQGVHNRIDILELKLNHHAKITYILLDFIIAINSLFNPVAYKMLSSFLPFLN